jgi:hypothetical protein
VCFLFIRKALSLLPVGRSVQIIDSLYVDDVKNPRFQMLCTTLVLKI